MRRDFRRRLVLFAALAWITAGCDLILPMSSATDPKAEANFQKGQSYKMIGQHARAAEYYHRALDVNPRNASAHYELGMLYSDPARLPEYGYAYYHLRRYVETTGQTNDALVNASIHAAGLKLAERYADAIGKIQTQGELEQIRRANAELARANASLTNAVRVLTEQLAAARAGVGVPVPQVVRAPEAPKPAQAIQTVPAARAAYQPRMTNQVDGARPAPRPVAPAPKAASPPPAPARRTHRVESGDTLARIARRHGVTVQQLQAANPGLDPRRLRAGMDVVLP